MLYAFGHGSLRGLGSFAMDTARNTTEPPPLADALERVAAEFVYHDRAGPATVRVQQHGRPDRLRRAMRAWAGCWGAAVVAVFLPVLHFVLVPALLVGGPLYAMVMMRERVTVLGADGDCPACGAAQHPRLKAGASERMEFRCESCRRALALRLPPELLKRD
jgi:hypothetical protein